MLNKNIKVLEMIMQDMENDAKKFDGQPFTGKVVAEYFGHQGAAISALANSVIPIFETTDAIIATGKFLKEEK